MIEDDRKIQKYCTSDRHPIRDADSDDERRDGIQHEKKKRSHGRRRFAREAVAVTQTGPETGSAMDVFDERFSRVFSSHMFAVPLQSGSNGPDECEI